MCSGFIFKLQENQSVELLLRFVELKLSLNDRRQVHVHILSLFCLILSLCLLDFLSESVPSEVTAASPWPELGPKHMVQPSIMHVASFF